MQVRYIHIDIYTYEVVSYFNLTWTVGELGKKD